MSASYEDYLAWDKERRLKYPTATHWIYKSRIDQFTVAEWNPMTGEASDEKER